MALALGMMFLCVRPQNQMFEITDAGVGRGTALSQESGRNNVSGGWRKQQCFVSGNLQDSSVSEIERVSED